MGYRTSFLVVMLLAFGIVGCDGLIGSGGDGGNDPSNPGGSDFPVDTTRPELASCDSFEPAAPFVYAAKIKTLLTGLGLTAEELDALTASPDVLRSQIDAWLDMPQTDDKLRRFFQTAFQQDGYEEQALVDLWGYNNFQMGRLSDGTQVDETFVRTFEESFARTVLDIFRANRPFTDVLTTQTVYLTTAQMVGLALSDDREIDDDNDRSYNRSRGMIDQLVYTTANVPLSETLNPSSPNWMRFTIPAEGLPGGCGGEAIKTNNDLVRAAFSALFGYYTDNDGCMPDNYRTTPLLGEEAFFDWRPVTIRAPSMGEEPTMFWEVDEMRASNELVLRVARVGFMTTPAFFATWPTNDANQARVTTNQTLIVALGKSFDSETTLIPAFDDALDDSHVDPTTACWGCHVNLDPMRQYFRNSFTYYYHAQQDASVQALRPSFAFQGVSVEGAPGDGITALASTLSNHPRFAPAWVQKACYFATSVACPEGSEEFQNVVNVFQQSGMSFRTMLVELFSSPLVSAVSCVEAAGGDIPSVSRARHFCKTVSNRLGISDACGNETYYQSERRGERGVNRQLIEVVPDDGYSRGGEVPIVIADPNLFIRAAGDAMCEGFSEMVVATDAQFIPGDPESAIRAFVVDLAGLPESDPRHASMLDILTRHYEQAEIQTNATDALRSTFMVACTSPSVLGMGL
ncbi:MAG: hypothetical protein OEM15_10730 [Myxococcales bacterium]|nr:hypothetical protein [Myxococcales bacterium]MDH3482975.1 hypothetical protein [Myxococcales bacterium]